MSPSEVWGGKVALFFQLIDERQHGSLSRTAKRITLGLVLK